MHIHYSIKNMFSVVSAFKKKSFLIAVAIMFSISAMAQVPLNDEPCNGGTLSAISLTPAAACTYSTFSNVDASNSTSAPNIPDPTCANFTDADVWFTTVVPPSATSVVIDTRQAGLQDGGMTVYTATGTCPNLVFTQIACDDNSSNNLSMPKITVSQPAGTRLYIRFWGFGGETGTFGICVTANIPPANNECTGAQSLTVNNNLNCAVVAAGTTANATLSTTPPNPTCGVTNAWDDDVWYSFVATNTIHRLSLLNVTGASTAMVMNTYSVPPGGDCTGLIQVNCTVGNTANLTGLTVGATYYVRVYNNVINAVSTTNFNICVGTPPPPPANDDCPAAVSVTVNPDFNCGSVTPGTTVSATQTAAAPPPTCSATGIDDDVWFSFTATNAAHRVSLLNITGTVTAMSFAVYSGTCGAVSLTQIGCNTANLLNLTGLTPGQVYYVRVFTTTAVIGSNASFNICVGTPPPPPANDECAGAVNLTVNPNYACGIVTAATTISATTTTAAPTPTCSPAGIDDDVWFRFTATNASHRISLLNIVGSTTAMTSVIYSGSCGALSLTQVSCNTTNLYNVGGLTPGQVYFIRVFTTSSTVGLNVNFNICVGTPPPPPSNDECTGAINLPVNANQLCAATTSGSTSGATQSAGPLTPTCSPANGWDDDVWYSFVAVGVNHTVSLLNVGGGTTTDMLTSVYSGTCGSLIQFACATVDPNFINLSNLTPGSTYYVRVQTEQVGADANFTICIGTPGPGATCSNGNPFCSTSGVTYPSVTNQPSLGGQGVYGCLFSTPNPTWFAFQVATSGNLNFQIQQTSAAGGGIDVDFAAWGPFTSQNDGCTQINATPATITPISCSYSTAAIETVVIPNAVAGQWYIVLITNFNGGAGTIQFTNLATSTGTTNCNIVCNTTAANNGPVCTGGTFNLTATALAGSTFAWSGPGFTSTTQNPVNVVAPTTPGSYDYNVIATLGAVACAATTTVVVAAPPPAPSVTSPITYCQNASAAPLTATVTTAGNTLLFYTTATGGTGVPTLTPSTATIGSTTYYVSQRTGVCEGPRASIVVNVVATTTPAVTINNSPVTYCQNATPSSLSNNATAAAGASLLWYTQPTGNTGSITPIVPSTSTPGSTTYYVSQIIGTCEGPRSPIVVNVTATSPAPVVTSPVNYCQNATATALTATGTNILWWGTSATGGNSTTIAPTPITTTVGTATYYVTQNTTGCESNPRTAITVVVNANPPAPVVTSPVTYCQNATAVPLTASGSNLTWYATATATTGTNIAPTPSTTTVGSTTYFVGAANGTCQSPRSSITVIVNPTPAAPTVSSPVTYCQGATAIPLTATGTNLLWYTSATGGTGTAVAPTPSTTNVGTTPYYVSATTGTCEGPRALINVVINTTPVAPLVTTPVNYCQGATATALTASGTNLLWYTSPTGGTGNATAPTPSTTTGGTTNYYVSSTVGVCEGPRALIAVVVTTLPVAPTVTTPVVYCQAATATALTATGSNLTWYTQPTGGLGSTTAPIPSTVNAGNTNYYVSASTSGVVCEGPRATIVVTVNPKPVAPTVVTPRAYCQNVTAVALTATIATGNTATWYTQATGGTGSATAPIPSTSSVGSFSYYVSQSALGCEGPRAEIVVNISPALRVNAGNNVTIARGDQTQLNATTTSSSNAKYLWTANVTPLALSSATILNPIANPIETTIYKITLTDTTGLCPSVDSTVTVTVIQSCINVRNAFTPNGDGINDLWFVYDQGFCLAKNNGCVVNVFNRYGTKVYENKNYTNIWDGKYKGNPLPDGTYYAVIEFTLFDGTKQVKRQDVTILR
jgi:gliding motility-associated-like protein